MRLLRTLPTRSLLILIAAVVAIVTGGTVIAVAASNGRGTPPPPKPLAVAIHDALAAPKPAGITGRVTFTNNLLPSGALFGKAGSALASGASGRLWLRTDGRGRIELQSDSGDTQVVWNRTALSVYDASSNTDYRVALPARHATSGHAGNLPTAAQISDFLAKLEQHLLLSGAIPATVAGRPAYDVSLSPKDSGGLLDSVHVAWDATHGVPLHVTVNAKSKSAPVLELAVSSISYGSVPVTDVAVTPPANAKVVDLSNFGASHGPRQKPVTGLTAVRAAAGFEVVAPDALAGRQRTNVRLAGKQVVLVYGKGLGAIVVLERKSDGTQHGGGPLKALPTVPLAGATGHELQTALGTVIAWQRGGVAYVLAGSVPAATAETAARGNA